MNFETISMNIKGGTANLTLNRPQKHNALNGQMLLEIRDAAEMLAQDRSLHSIVLSANGPSFCAGGDLTWMQEQQDATPEKRASEAQKLVDALSALNDLPQILIGDVRGNVFGGGIGLLSVCDIVVAKSDIRMALTETRLGLIPATIGPFILRALGTRFARQVFATTLPISETLALRSGLISEFCNQDDIDAKIEEKINTISKTAPHAVGLAKEYLKDLSDLSFDDQKRLSVKRLSQCWENAETQKIIGDFLKDRK